jgi:hypothetical protein
MEDGPAARRGSRQKAWLRESDPILTFTYWRVGEWGGKNKNKELKHTKKERKNNNNKRDITTYDAVIEILHRKKLSCRPTGLDPTECDGIEIFRLK